MSDWLVPAVGMLVVTFSYEVGHISANYKRFMPVWNLVATLSLGNAFKIAILQTASSVQCVQSIDMREIRLTEVATGKDNTF